MNSTILGLLSAAVALAASQTTPATGDTQARNIAVVQEAHAALAADDFGAFQATLTPDYVRHCQVMPAELQERRGSEHFIGFVRAFKASICEYEDSITNVVAAGDRGAYVSTISGVQTGPLGGMPATGKALTLVNIIIQRLDNGRIAETWVS